MPLDDRAPVIVGVGELMRRPDADGVELEEPAAMMARALRLAADDAGPGERLLRRARALGAVPAVAWMDGDPGRRVAALLGLEDVRTLRSSLQGGNGPQLLVTTLADRIQKGQLDVALVCGAEALQSVVQAGKRGLTLDWPAPDTAAHGDEVLEGEQAPTTAAEEAAGIAAPIIAYPLVENAIRHARGATVAGHLEKIAGIWSRFSDVAASQPCAWTPRRFTPDELREPSDDNRRVTFPYLKLMNANIQVDQTAALILCSAGAAAAAGVPRDRWVFVHAGAHAADVWHMSERRDLHRSPAIAACGKTLFAHGGCGPGDLAHVDLYSCFPSAVQLAADALGLPDDDPARPLTCTGGLTFFGGPGNNYATHAIAAVARRLRGGSPGELGLATAIGWYATKHALGLYANQPPARPFAQLAPEAPAHTRAVAPSADAAAAAETCTVVYGRDGTPSYGVLFALLGDGRRGLARTEDADVMAAMTTDAFLGSRVRLRRDGGFDPA